MAFSILVIALLLLAGTGCDLPNARKFLRDDPRLKASGHGFKLDSSKDVLVEADNVEWRNGEALRIGKVKVSSIASEPTRAQGDAAAQILPHYQIALANNQQNLAFVDSMSGRLLDFTATVIPQVMADRQAKRDARQTQQGGPNTQVDAFLGLLDAGLPGLDPGTQAMLDDAIQRYLRVRSGQATPGPGIGGTP